MLCGLGRLLLLPSAAQPWTPQAPAAARQPAVPIIIGIGISISNIGISIESSIGINSSVSGSSSSSQGCLEEGSTDGAHWPQRQQARDRPAVAAP